MKGKNRRNKSGQIWIETVLYTLIGLALIGIALGFLSPKINEARDKLLVEQTINSLSDFDEKVSETIQKGAGNVRQIELLIRRGEFWVNGANDSLQIILSGLSSPYSEPGVEIPVGRVKMLSVQGQKTSTVYLTIQYNANITYAGGDLNRVFTAASIPYKFSIENEGVSDPQNAPRILINIEEISNRQA